MRLVEELTNLEKNFKDWNSIPVEDKNSYLCLNVLCDECPLHYTTRGGNCKGRSYAYKYAKAKRLIEESKVQLDRFEEEKKRSDNIEDKGYYQDRIDQYNKAISEATMACSKIIQSLSLKEIDESKIPTRVPEEPKKKKMGARRVWTPEQIERAKETRRKTLEAKKLAKQNQPIPKKEIEEVVEKKKDEPISNCIQEAVKVIMTKIQGIHDKMNSMTQSIEDLRKQGVEIEYSIPDLGEKDLNEDLKILDQASKVVNKYLGQGTDAESVHS